LDSERVYSIAMRKVIADLGYEVDENLRFSCLGRRSLAVAGLVIDKYGIELSPSAFVELYESEAMKMIRNLPLMPGVDELLRHLHDQYIPMAIATSSSSAAMKIKACPHRNLFSVMHHVVCGDDPELERSKPFPDIFLIAASRFNPPAKPECCLVFEDSPAGMQAGVAAGMQVVMIPDPTVPDEQREGATLVLNSMSEFVPELFGLPYID
ncbi:hypothetical protein KR093_007093, partial [Drosophila rubida]